MFANYLFLFGEAKHNRSELEFPAATVNLRQNAAVAGLAIAF